MSEIIIRTVHLPDCTIGQLELKYSSFRCFTLELPWLDNKQDVSSIPPGTYQYKKRKSPSLGWVIHLQDVEGRTWIYIHKGNFTSDILGCILLGTGIADINSDSTPDVTNSGRAFDELYDNIEDFGTVTIIR
jgi:hypothetical protein